MPENNNFTLPQGVDWLSKLCNTLISIRRKREDEFNSVNMVVGKDPVALAKSYIQPDGQDVNPVDRKEDEGLTSRSELIKLIFNFFKHQHFNQAGNNQLVILADAGMGKSALLGMLKMMHLTAFFPQEKECVLLKLGQDTLAKVAEIHNRLGTILLLDSLDEDPCLATQGAKARLIELLDATRDFYRVIITCRTQFFPEYEADTLKGPGFFRVGGYVCQLKYLSYFNDDQVLAFLNKRYASYLDIFRKNKQIGRARGLIERMGALRCRPMLLAYIDDLMKSQICQQESVTEYDIYTALVEQWLLREQKLRGIEPKQLHRACLTLASEMMLQRKRSISLTELDALCDDYPQLKLLPREHITGRSLLNMDSDRNYRFAHYSIQEYLVAHRLLNDAAWQPASVMSHSDLIVSMLRTYLERNHSVMNENVVRYCLGGGPYVLSDLIRIPAGEFLMGCGMGEGSLSERPQHLVYLDEYYIAKYPVTVERYRQFCMVTGRQMPEPPIWGWQDTHPIVNVSYEDATAYAAWVGMELPTEAEWEKAARGAEGLIYPWGNDWDASKCCNSSGKNKPKGTVPVGSYPEGNNKYGVFDLAGNVWEWCADWYAANYYKNAPTLNPIGPERGTFHVLRGGSWCDSGSRFFRSGCRFMAIPDRGNDCFGFRCVFRPPKQK